MNRVVKRSRCILFTYFAGFKKDLEKEVMGDTSGHFKRLMVSQLSANRQEGQAVDQALAAQDADDLHKVEYLRVLEIHKG